MIEYVGLTVDGDVLDMDGGLVGNVVVATVCGALCVVGDEPGVDGGLVGNVVVATVCGALCVVGDVLGMDGGLVCSVVGITEGTFCVDGCVGSVFCTQADKSRQSKSTGIMSFFIGFPPFGGMQGGQIGAAESFDTSAYLFYHMPICKSRNSPFLTLFLYI